MHRTGVTYVEEILYGTLWIIKRRAERTHDLFTLKTHLNHVLDRGLESIAGKE